MAAQQVLLAALRPGMPRPIGYLTGEQGTGKSTSGQMLAGVIEGPRAPLRQAPENLRDLGPTTAAGWVLALDNLSGLPGWLSDALCRIVTGDAQVTRALYTDDDVNVLTYQRPVLLTGIDLGALRNDLAERMMPLELQPIPRHKRRTASALWAAYERAHPRILGALLDLAAEVWAVLPYAAAELTERPRLADFAELLHALDRVTGWRSLDAFNGAQDALNDAVLDGHPVAAALHEWTTSPTFPLHGWQGAPWPSSTGCSAATGAASRTAGPRRPQYSARVSDRSRPRSAPVASTWPARQPVTRTASCGPSHTPRRHNRSPDISSVNHELSASRAVRGRLCEHVGGNGVDRNEDAQNSLVIDPLSLVRPLEHRRKVLL
ncbi:hypothetical protein [Streptomyces wuyuanensis]|uniref:hypothetical protein n=1 Tax=Streptomyces wuyuanensis TaxID=1196353 RepID=UPI003721B8D7